MEDRRERHIDIGPSAMDTNGHFAAVGSANDKAAYEHGVQVIDENKEFKYVCYCSCHWRIAGISRGWTRGL